VLDLAAAPGGKATQIAGRLGDHGLVVANEVQPSRTRPWPTTSTAGDRPDDARRETVARLAERLPERFDRVLLDAPCSGEGLFRRNPAAAAQWRPGHVRGSADRQRALLADAAALVRPGGVLVYSTCTFAPEENEQQVAGFLAAHPGWELLDIPWHEGFTRGRPDWSPDGSPELARTVRLWPHHLRGEGHFIAKLVASGQVPRWPGAGPPGGEGRGYPGPRVWRPRGSTGGARRLAGVHGRCAGGGPGEVDGVGERAYLVPTRRWVGSGCGWFGRGCWWGGCGRGGSSRRMRWPWPPGWPTPGGSGVDDREAAAWVRGEAWPGRAGRVDGGHLERLAAWVGAGGRGDAQEPLPQGPAYDET
jgi:hypothetical protein